MALDCVWIILALTFGDDAWTRNLCLSVPYREGYCRRLGRWFERGHLLQQEESQTLTFFFSRRYLEVTHCYLGTVHLIPRGFRACLERLCAPWSSSGSLASTPLCPAGGPAQVLPAGRAIAAPAPGGWAEEALPGDAHAAERTPRVLTRVMSFRVAPRASPHGHGGTAAGAGAGSPPAGSGPRFRQCP